MAGAQEPGEALAQMVLAEIEIPDKDDIRGHITLPMTIERDFKTWNITWSSSNPDMVSDKPAGPIAAGVVQRPAPGAEPAQVTLTASVEADVSDSSQKNHITKIISREFRLTIKPSMKLAPFSRYAMVNFALSNCDRGQQIYMAYSIGNDPTRWNAANNGKAVLTSTKGMHAVRDPSIIRSPDGDKFYLLATDLNVDGTEHGWRGWDWAQSGASRSIEIWESRDLRTWSEQRHVLVGPPEAGMVFAPEAIWDPEIGAYVVFWTSSMYPADTYFTEDAQDPKRRYPLTRNQTLYATTRDFVTFSPARVMSGREDHGTLDACMVLEEETGYYHRFVCDRISTGVGVTRYAGACPVDDIYQERSKRVLAPEEDWELVAGCITHNLMNTNYAEAPLAFRANPGDLRGGGYYFFSDQIWADSSAGEPLEEQLHPYWTENLSSGKWEVIDWAQKPEYDGCRGVMRHGTIISLTCAEHAALRGVELVSLSVEQSPQSRCTSAFADGFNLTNLLVTATYSDGSTDVLSEGYGGYVLLDSELCSTTSEKRMMQVSYTVLEVTRTATFKIDARKGE